MMQDYKYVDPDHLYTDPKTGVLINKLGIDDEQQLAAIEGFETGVRLFELKRKPIKIKTADTLLTIHGYIFQDLYDWAGKVRTVQISKQGNQFLPTDRFTEGFSELNRLLKMRGNNRIAEDGASAFPSSENIGLLNRR
jgi:cell filamentation protein